MGDLEQIEKNWSQLIKNGKNSSFDYVKDTDNLDSILRIVSSFANTDGGDLLIGINEKSKLIGVSPEEIKPELSNLFTTKDLKSIVSFHTLYISHIILLRIEVGVAKNKIGILEGQQKNFYYRVGGSTVLANKIILRFWRMTENSFQVDCSQENLDHLFSLIEREHHLSLSKMYKKSTLSKNEVDRSVSCLLFKNRISVQVEEGKISFQTVKN